MKQSVVGVNVNLAIFGLTVLWASLPALASDYYVAPNGDGDYRSPTTPGGDVAYAVNILAAQGDTIHLAIGDYDLAGQGESYSHLVPGVKNLTIIGGSDNSADTRLIGDGTRRIIYLEKKSGKDGSGLTVRNLTVRNGKTSYQGGGICGNKIPFVVSNVLVEACSSAYQGGGAYCGTWIDCTFGGCSMSGKYVSETTMHGFGGAAFGGTYRHCLFTNNTATAGYGGALGGSSDDVNWVTFADNCTFSNNVAKIAGGALFGCTATNSTIACNVAQQSSNSPTYSGGGAGESTLIDCRILCNTNAACIGGGTAGGTNISCYIAGNYANYGGGVFGGANIGCSFYGNTCKTSCGTAAFKSTTYNCRIWGHGGNSVLADGYHQGDLVYSNSMSSSGFAIGQQYATASAVNCTVADNVGCGISKAAVTNCLAFGNSKGDVSSLVDAVNSAWGTGAGPAGAVACHPDITRPFVTEVGESQDAYSLNTDSICVDRALTLNWMAGAFDILGNKRVFNNDPDIGACEAFWRRGLMLIFK